MDNYWIKILGKGIRTRIVKILFVVVIFDIILKISYKYGALNPRRKLQGYTKKCSISFMIYLNVVILYFFYLSFVIPFSSYKITFDKSLSLVFFICPFDNLVANLLGTVTETKRKQTSLTLY